MIIVIGLLMCLLIVLWGVIASLAGGVALYRRTPKPPKGWTYDEYKDYYEYMRSHDIQTCRGNLVREYVEAGEIMKAVHELRIQTGCSFEDAMAAVEQLEISVRRQRAM